MKLFIINGPNLNFLGIREPEIYGKESLENINQKIQTHLDKTEYSAKFFQSNAEGEIVDAIQEAYHQQADGIVINPAALTHYSYAVHDAVKAVGIPTVEVHLSAIHSREEFRQKSVVASACIGQISGFGSTGYLLAIQALEEHFKKEQA